MAYRIFVINPGSSSLKVAYFEDDKQVFSFTRRHAKEDFDFSAPVYTLVDRHYEMILEMAAEKGLNLADMDAFAVRGGFCKPVQGGTYTINDALLDDLKHARYGEHISNVGPFCAKRLEDTFHKKAYYTNPVSVDEFMDLSYVTGIPEVRRSSVFHALNHKAVAGYAAKQLGKKYDEANLIVAHLGGGISIGAHQKGRVIDATTPSNEGPMTIDRPGDIPNLSVIELCYHSGLTYEQMVKKFSSGAGIAAYANGESDLIKIEEAALTDKTLALALDNMCYRIAFWVCAMAAALSGDIDAVVLTGGMAKSDWIVPKVMERIKFLAPVMVIKGEFEMEALAEGAIRVLSGEERAREY